VVSTPIPLAAPDGTVYAYACGRCNRVSVMGHTLMPVEDIGGQAERSREEAADCCVCRTCGAPVEAENRGYRSCVQCDEACRAKNRAEAAARVADLAARGMRECVPCRGFGCDDRADEECPDCDGTGEVPL
jgi:hypothetical protein